MALSYRTIDNVPEDGYRRGPRDSVCLEVIRQLNQEPTKIVAVDGGTADELQKFYKAMIQWRSRHRELGLGIRKGVDAVYVWYTSKITA